MNDELLKAISSHKLDEIQLSLGLAVYFEYLLGWKIPRSDRKQNIHTGAVARQLLQLWPISFRYKPLGSVISKKKHFIQVISLWQCARCNKYSNQRPNPVIAGFHPRNDLKLPLAPSPNLTTILTILLADEQIQQSYKGWCVLGRLSIFVVWYQFNATIVLPPHHKIPHWDEFEKN